MHFLRNLWRDLYALFFCQHVFRFNRNIYGDEITLLGGQRSEFCCVKCGRLRYYPFLKS